MDVEEIKKQQSIQRKLYMQQYMKSYREDKKILEINKIDPPCPFCIINIGENKCRLCGHTNYDINKIIFWNFNTMTDNENIFSLIDDKIYNKVRALNNYTSDKYFYYFNFLKECNDYRTKLFIYNQQFNQQNIIR